MTNEEAIKQIDDVLSSDYHYDETLGYQLTSDDFEWLEKSKKALEKQIPKKPIEDTANLTDFKTFHCPICNKKIVSRLDGEWIAGRPQKYCDDCGQALDFNGIGSDKGNE